MREHVSAFGSLMCNLALFRIIAGFKKKGLPHEKETLGPLSLAACNGPGDHERLPEHHIAHEHTFPLADQEDQMSQVRTC